jgi:NADP-dependent 3-hydroxy acid dehydrogenase YdfG
MRRRILITGATSGIGKATALKFASSGCYDLLLVARRKEVLERIASEYSHYGCEIKTAVCDVRNPSKIKELVIFHKEWLNDLHILFNNAGLAKGLDFLHETDPEHTEEMIDTNIKGLLYMSREILPFFIAKGGGQIINMGSTAGKEVYPKGTVYCATKFAVEAITKGLRMEYFDKNIKVGQISPGHVENTNFAKVRFSGDENKANIYGAFNPLTAEDVAESVFYLASQPDHVNIQDVYMMGTQQASAQMIDKSGRKYDKGNLHF